jgi:putative tryptophan/tyrosine transport system substrate-binding protein
MSAPGKLVRHRREVIAGLGATAWSVAAWAQNERMRSVGLLWGTGVENDPYVAAFRDALAKLGWIEGLNLQLDIRFGNADAGRIRALSSELVGFAPDVIVPNSLPATIAVQQLTQTIPIVFAAVGDPFVTGIVKNIARPEGNATGVTNYFPSMGGKWVELLKEAVPETRRVGLVYDPRTASGAYFPSIEEGAKLLHLQVERLSYNDAIDIVRGIDAFAIEPNGSLIMTPPSPSAVNRQTITRLAIQHRLPTVFIDRLYVVEGGLISYGPNGADLNRRAAFYVDRILRGAKPTDLPVEFPTKFEFVINLKTAKALGLTVPQSILVRADEMIE